MDKVNFGHSMKNIWEAIHCEDPHGWGNNVLKIGIGSIAGVVDTFKKCGDYAKTFEDKEIANGDLEIVYAAIRRTKDIGRFLDEKDKQGCSGILEKNDMIDIISYAHAVEKIYSNFTDYDDDLVKFISK